ncbi:MAG: N-acetyl-gamma-glutamyl-phosphate reductase [Elusimicrobiota bacterium]
MIKAGIIGITGYTGEELLKILSKHPGVEISVLASRSAEETKPVKEIYPHLAHLSLSYEKLDAAGVAKRSDVVFLALPHKVSFEVVPELLSAGKNVIDLSADFRIEDVSTYEQWYGGKHAAPANLKEAVYGLPELYRDKIAKARLIANPGCYPTTIILGAAPALKHKLIEPDSIIIDAKSGISGAGRKSVEEYYKNEHPNFRPYNIAGVHRHIPEIEQELSKVAGKKITVTFTPQIIPVERGMVSSIYMNLKKKLTTQEAIGLYGEFYAKEPFVRIFSDDKIPDVRNVANTNFCDITVRVDARANRLIVISAIDNLVKGASGQAVQNMNIMYGFKETEALI